MIWSQFFLKILGVNYENCALDKINQRKLNKEEIHIWNGVRLSLRAKNIIVNQILLSKFWNITQIYTISKYREQEIEKRIYNFLWEDKK